LDLAAYVNSLARPSKDLSNCPTFQKKVVDHPLVRSQFLKRSINLDLQTNKETKKKDAKK
jgi:hypothetical protein